MKNRQQEIIRRTVDILRQHLKPKRIFLFGSRAKGRAVKGSDFDFAVDQRRPALSTQRRISTELEEIGGLHHIDVVYWPNLDKEFQSIIKKTGRVIYERRSPARA